MTHIIYKGTPALPHTFSYTPQNDDPVLISLSGTAWTFVMHSKIGIEMLIDGKVVNSAFVWSNGKDTHRTLHTGLVDYAFPLNVDPTTEKITPIEITVRAIPGTNFDVNDYLTIAVV